MSVSSTPQRFDVIPPRAHAPVPALVGRGIGLTEIDLSAHEGAGTCAVTGAPNSAFSAPFIPALCGSLVLHLLVGVGLGIALGSGSGVLGSGSAVGAGRSGGEISVSIVSDPGEPLGRASVDAGEVAAAVVDSTPREAVSLALPAVGEMVTVSLAPKPKSPPVHKPVVQPAQARALQTPSVKAPAVKAPAVEGVARAPTQIVSTRMVTGSGALGRGGASEGLGEGSGDGSGVGSGGGVGLGAARARVVYAPKPPYPYAARRAGFEGRVTVQVSLDSEGLIRDAALVRSSGRSDCDEAAIDTILRRWRFEPAEMRGRAIASRETIVVVFSLRNF